MSILDMEIPDSLEQQFEVPYEELMQFLMEQFPEYLLVMTEEELKQLEQTIKDAAFI